MNISSSTRPLLIKTFLFLVERILDREFPSLPARFTSSSTSRLRFLLLHVSPKRIVAILSAPFSTFRLQLNSSSLRQQQMKVYRHRVVARFGLMHMIGTNLSVWLSVLVQETKHEILTFYNPENNSLRISHRLGKRDYYKRNLRFVKRKERKELKSKASMEWNGN